MKKLKNKLATLLACTLIGCIGNYKTDALNRPLILCTQIEQDINKIKQYAEKEYRHADVAEGQYAFSERTARDDAFQKALDKHRGERVYPRDFFTCEKDYFGKRAYKVIMVYEIE